MKDGQNLSLQNRAQIDQNVAAADQIQPGEGWVLSQVVSSEHASFADLLADLVSCPNFREEALQPLR